VGVVIGAVGVRVKVRVSRVRGRVSRISRVKVRVRLRMTDSQPMLFSPQ